MLTGIYAAVLALIQVFLTLRVVKMRHVKKVSLGDGGQEELVRRIRGHGNFTETVPIAVLLMLIAELSGSPFWCIHALGVLMVIARLMHYIGVVSGSGHGKFRYYGMVITVNIIALSALLCFWLAWPALLDS